MPPAPEELRERRAAQRQRLLRRRRLLPLAGLAALAATGGIALAVNDDGDGVPQPAAAPAPVAPELSDAQLVGQRLIAGFDGARVPGELRRMIARGRIAGVILFAGNVEGKRATARLVGRLQRIRRPADLSMPLAVMTDQEGGLVKRVPGAPSASAAEMGERGGGFAARQGRATARNLRGVGVNVDLAPVLDVARDGSAVAAEGRTFGGSPARVIDVGVRGFSRGLREGGVAATAKHFPGLGAARVNTDDASQVIDIGRDRLRARDEAPFDAFAEAGGEMVMLGLATYPAFSDRPAALSRQIATGELRGRLGFAGVSITDSLDAAAATSFASRERVAIGAVEAGSDLLLYGDWRTAREVSRALRRTLASGKLDRGEFEAAVERVLALRRGLPD